MYPVQWVALRPQVAWQGLGDVFVGKQDVLDNLQAANAQLLAQAVRTSQLEQLELENRHLRELLELRQRVATPALAAEVLYEAGDPYTRKMVLDKGALNGVVQSSPVMDEKGILGQITRDSYFSCAMAPSAKGICTFSDFISRHLGSVSANSTGSILIRDFTNFTNAANLNDS
jgi:cell shape-determining protein MreC